MGIILLAKKRGIISQASVLIEELIKSGMRFDRKWITDALSLVGEKINF